MEQGNAFAFILITRSNKRVLPRGFTNKHQVSLLRLGLHPLAGYRNPIWKEASISDFAGRNYGMDYPGVGLTFY